MPKNEDIANFVRQLKKQPIDCIDPDSVESLQSQKIAAAKARITILQHAITLSMDVDEKGKLDLKKNQNEFILESSIYEKYKNKIDLLSEILSYSNVTTQDKTIALDSLKCLFKDMVINDEPINNYLQDKFGTNQKINLLNSFTFGDSQNSLHKRIINKTLTAPRIAKLAAQIKNAELTFCPINRENIHWHMAVIRKDDNNSYSIFCLDGLNEAEFHQTSIKKVSEVLKALMPDCIINSSTSFIIPKQSDGKGCGVDCGAVICYWALQIAQDMRLLSSSERYQKTTCNYSQFRLDMAHTLASHIVKKTKDIDLIQERVESASVTNESTVLIPKETSASEKPIDTVPVPTVFDSAPSVTATNRQKTKFRVKLFYMVLFFGITAIASVSGLTAMVLALAGIKVGLGATFVASSVLVANIFAIAQAFKSSVLENTTMRSAVAKPDLTKIPTIGLSDATPIILINTKKTSNEKGASQNNNKACENTLKF